MASREYLTPEEIESKKERKKKIFYISIPLLAAGIGAGIALLSQAL